METEDLIKKLEKIEFPQIEIPSHKNRLKMILIDWKYRKEKKVGWLFIVLKRILLPLGTVAVILAIALIVNNLLFFQYGLADVK